jgi:hypothetical protein
MWDNNPGRICLTLDAAAAPPAIPVACTAVATAAAAAHLLIDGKPQWVWVAEQDVELL